MHMIHSARRTATAAYPRPVHPPGDAPALGSLPSTCKQRYTHGI